MTKKSESSARCSGCGKELKATDDIVRIAAGSLNKKGVFKEKAELYILHRSPCFNLTFNSPDTIMDEVRRLDESVGG